MFIFTVIDKRTPVSVRASVAGSSVHLSWRAFFDHKHSNGLGRQLTFDFYIQLHITGHGDRSPVRESWILAQQLIVLIAISDGAK